SPAEPSADELAPPDGDTDEAVPVASKDKAGPDHEIDHDHGTTAPRISVVWPQADFKPGGGAAPPDAEAAGHAPAGAPPAPPGDEAEGLAPAGAREARPDDADMATGPVPAAAARAAVAAEPLDQAGSASGNANRAAAPAGDGLAEAGRADRTVPAGTAAATPA